VTETTDFIPAEQSSAKTTGSSQASSGFDGATVAKYAT